MKTTVIHHSADFDGIFCREIARKFLPDAELIGWDFGDKPLPIPDGKIYVLDLPVDRPFGFNFSKPNEEQSELEFQVKMKDKNGELCWIDHHKSSIDSHPNYISGFRIDGVAACRLAWQWFSRPGEMSNSFPKSQFVDRNVSEPYAVRLAGEYDIWDKRDPNADVFQFGLRSRELDGSDWQQLLDDTVEDTLQGTGMEVTNSNLICGELLENGHLLQSYQQRNDASILSRSVMVNFEGLKFLALNTARCNSLTFAAKDVPETGHDALMGFYWNGFWNVSLYHAKHRTDLDLSTIATKYGGGGHRGACGFQMKTFPFAT